MSGFIEGENRYQSTLFPERIDDYVEEESAARVIDVFVDRLDISGLGFKTEPAETGRPGYHPRTMMKIIIYGYMNKVHSSRRLEAEAKRSVELMWLTGRLAPDFKTIADFRKDNGEAIRLVCREFVVLCRKLDLFSKAFVAIDGAKFKAVNTRDKNFTKAKLKRRLQQIDESIERYLGQIASADRREDEVSADKSQRLKDKISALEKEMDRLKKLEVRLFAEPDQQISLTDPDARSMATSDYRRIGRWEHEHVVESLDARLEREPERMRVRRSTAEHPFGTLKCWMGYTHFLTKTVPKVSTEMSLHVLAYNMKRMINILGHKRLIEAITV